MRSKMRSAVLHTPYGTEVTVTVDCTGRIEVADHGSGVPLKDRENIFKRFWRGPGERNEGAGLGLAIVRETMRAHRGGVSVADNRGGGATFTLAFPSLPAGEGKMPGEGFAGGRA